MKNLALLLLILSTAPMAAQEINFGEIYGSIYAPTEPLPAVSGLAASVAPGVLFSFTPVIQDSPSALAAGAVFGGRMSFRRPVTLSASYLRILPDGDGADLNRFGLTGNATVAAGNGWGVALVADFWTIDDVAQSGRALVAAERALFGGLAAALNAGWATVDRESSADADDLVAGVGLSYKIPDLPLAIGADYSIENDVDGNSRWSISLMHQLTRVLPDSRLKLAAQRNDTYVASLWIPLKRR